MPRFVTSLLLLGHLSPSSCSSVHCLPLVHYCTDHPPSSLLLATFARLAGHGCSTDREGGEAPATAVPLTSRSSSRAWRHPSISSLCRTMWPPPGQRILLLPDGRPGRCYTTMAGAQTTPVPPQAPCASISSSPSSCSDWWSPNCCQRGRSCQQPKWSRPRSPSDTVQLRLGVSAGDSTSQIRKTRPWVHKSSSRLFVSGRGG